MDENDPIVRAVSAPFEAALGEHRRGIDDVSTQYQQEMTTIDEKIKEREEKLKQEKEGTAAPEEPKAPPKPQWDYDNPLAEQQRRAAWGTPPPAPAPAAPPPSAPPRPAPSRRAPEPAWDYNDPLAAGAPTPSRGWGRVSEPPTQGFAVPEPPAAPPAPPRRPARPARPTDPADDDYSGQSWLE